MTNSSESFLDATYESYINLEPANELFGLFKKKPKIESTQEAKKLELEIRKKTLAYLKNEVKRYHYDQEYKKAICSWPAMELKLSKHGVQIAKDCSKYGILFSSFWPNHIKNWYYEHQNNLNGVIDRFPDEFESGWYHELIESGCSFAAEQKVPDNFILQVSNNDFMENDFYIEVFEKIPR